MRRSLAKLEILDPRTIWPSEPRDFTPCLADNIDVLGKVLGTELKVTATEANFEDFSLDILARDLATGIATNWQHQ